MSKKLNKIVIIVFATVLVSSIFYGIINLIKKKIILKHHRKIAKKQIAY